MGLLSCQTDNTKLTKTINKKLVLATSVDNETGEMIGEGNTFVIMNDGWVEASLDLTKYMKKQKNDLMIHLDWVDEEGNSFYIKEQVLTKKSATVNTAVSITPELRNAGDYTLNVYAFRELVASKSFKLLPEYKFDKAINENIEISTRANRKTTKYKSEKPSISVMEDKWVKASVKLSDLPKTEYKKLLYQLNWRNEKGEIVYKKRFSVNADDKNPAIDCSIEVAPEKKEIGVYKVELLLFGQTINETGFTLKPALDVSKINANVSLWNKVKDGNRVGETTEFTIGKKKKVNVIFDLENCLAFGKEEELQFKISWLGIDGKRFYSKRFNFKPKTDKITLKSAISIAPKKRPVGIYKSQLFLFNKLIAETDFKLNEVSNKNKIKTAITFYSKINKTTKKMVDVGVVFKTKDKAKVRALISVKNPEIYGKMKGLKFRLDWVGTDDKVFYSKKIETLPFEAATGIKSAISIPTKKRNPGSYKLKVYLFGKLVNEKSFELK